MKAHPILFSGPMVRALLQGRKTQTRRIVKNPIRMVKAGWSKIEYGPICSQTPNKCPYGKPGDLLWLWETWKPHSIYAHLKPRDIPPSEIFYQADDEYAPSNTPWRPNIFLLRWASRLTLEITNVRVERLQDITEKDAIAEGIENGWITKDHWKIYYKWALPNETFENPIDSYQSLWEVLNGKDSWHKNPWVWVIEFKVHKCNVDQLLKVAA